MKLIRFVCVTTLSAVENQRVWFVNLLFWRSECAMRAPDSIYQFKIGRLASRFCVCVCAYVGSQILVGASRLTISTFICLVLLWIFLFVQLKCCVQSMRAHCMCTSLNSCLDYFFFVMLIFFSLFRCGETAVRWPHAIIFVRALFDSIIARKRYDVIADTGYCTKEMLFSFSLSFNRFEKKNIFAIIFDLIFWFHFIYYGHFEYEPLRAKTWGVSATKEFAYRE